MSMYKRTVSTFFHSRLVFWQLTCLELISCHHEVDEYDTSLVLRTLNTIKKRNRVGLLVCLTVGLCACLFVYLYFLDFQTLLNSFVSFVLAIWFVCRRLVICFVYLLINLFTCLFVFIITISLFALIGLYFFSLSISFFFFLDFFCLFYPLICLHWLWFISSYLLCFKF